MSYDVVYWARNQRFVYSRHEEYDAAVATARAFRRNYQTIPRVEVEQNRLDGRTLVVCSLA